MAKKCFCFSLFCLLIGFSFSLNASIFIDRNQEISHPSYPDFQDFNQFISTPKMPSGFPDSYTNKEKGFPSHEFWTPYLWRTLTGDSKDADTYVFSPPIIFPPTIINIDPNISGFKYDENDAGQNNFGRLLNDNPDLFNNLNIEDTFRLSIGYMTYPEFSGLKLAKDSDSSFVTLSKDYSHTKGNGEPFYNSYQFQSTKGLLLYVPGMNHADAIKNVSVESFGSFSAKVKHENEGRDKYLSYTMVHGNPVVNFKTNKKTFFIVSDLGLRLWYAKDGTLGISKIVGLNNASHFGYFFPEDTTFEVYFSDLLLRQFYCIKVTLPGDETRFSMASLPDQMNDHIKIDKKKFSLFNISSHGGYGGFADQVKDHFDYKGQFGGGVFDISSHIYGLKDGQVKLGAGLDSSVLENLNSGGPFEDHFRLVSLDFVDDFNSMIDLLMDYRSHAFQELSTSFDFSIKPVGEQQVVSTSFMVNVTKANSGSFGYVRFNFDLSTKDVSADYSEDTLMALYPHQWLYAYSKIQDNHELVLDENSDLKSKSFEPHNGQFLFSGDHTDFDYTYQSSKGPMKVISGTSFTTHIPVQNYVPYLPLPDPSFEIGVSLNYYLNHLTTSLTKGNQILDVEDSNLKDVDMSKTTSADYYLFEDPDLFLMGSLSGNNVLFFQDTYSNGKRLGKVSQLLPVLQRHPSQSVLIQALKTQFDHWLEYSDQSIQVTLNGVLTPLDGSPTELSLAKEYTLAQAKQAQQAGDKSKEVNKDVINLPPGLFAFFSYNPEWDTLIGYPSSFWTDTLIQDHHYHYGYFISAAAMLEEFSPGYFSDDQKKVIHEMIKDVAYWPDTWKNIGLELQYSNPYPVLRSYDPYFGHSLANSHGEFATGYNQESTSESLQFAASLIHWGSVTGQDDIKDLGFFLYTSETAAVKEYWFNQNGIVFPKNLMVEYPLNSKNYKKQDFNVPNVGIVWSNKMEFQTFWSPVPAYISGIQMLPVTSHLFYMSGLSALEKMYKFSTDSIQTDFPVNLIDYKAYLSDVFVKKPIWQELYRWRDLLIEGYSLWSFSNCEVLHDLDQLFIYKDSQGNVGYKKEYVPYTYIDEINDNLSVSEESLVRGASGETRAHTYYWTHYLHAFGAPDFSVQSTDPLSIVLKNEQTNVVNGVAYTYLIYNEGESDKTVSFYHTAEGDANPVTKTATKRGMNIFYALDYPIHQKVLSLEVDGQEVNDSGYVSLELGSDLSLVYHSLDIDTTSNSSLVLMKSDEIVPPLFMEISSIGLNKDISLKPQVASDLGEYALKYDGLYNHTIVSFEVLSAQTLVEYPEESFRFGPNPFNPIHQTGYFEFMNGPLTEVLDVTVKIFRMDGKLLWTHQQNFLESGLKSIPWSGCDSFGVPLPSGVYYAFVTMTGDGGDPFRKTIKVAILR